jgi:hypothetical protein
MKLKHTADIAVGTSHNGMVKRKALLRGEDTGLGSNILSMNEAYLAVLAENGHPVCFKT